jgi:heterodisulfide reductase subunit D
MGLKEVAEWLHYCGRCNSCKYIYRDYSPSCPAFEKYRWEPYTSSGKVWMARDLYEGKYKISESIRDKVFACTLCGNCTVQCQQLISDHALDVFEALREECIDAGLALPEHEFFRKNVEKVHNPYGEPHDNRWVDIDKKYFKNSADVLFFVGCTSALRDKGLLKDVLDVLDHLGVDFTLSKDEWCCGSPLLTTGQKKYAQELATHNVEMIKNIGVKTVITACAGCFRTLKTQYPRKYELLNEEEGKPGYIQVLHISQFINMIIKKKQFGSSKKTYVTYHDPCHLGRHVGVFDEPREVIKKVKNVELIEMPRNRDNAWCCGAGAGVKSAFKDWAIEISEDRVQEALDLNKSTGKKIEYLVTTCPFCERNLKDSLESLRSKKVEGADQMEVIDLIQFLKKLI